MASRHSASVSAGTVASDAARAQLKARRGTLQERLGDAIVELAHALELTSTESRVHLSLPLVLPAPRVEWEEVEEMARPTRGGFGSTGG